MNRRRHIIAIGMMVLVLGFIGFGSASAAETKSAQANWDNLKPLAAGDEVRVVLSDGKSYPATYQGFSDEAIVVRTSTGEQTFSRHGVLRVSVKRDSRRKRNALIGAAVGCAAGLGIAAAYASSQQKEYPQNRYFEVLGPTYGAILGAAGAGLGVAFSRGAWREVYRARDLQVREHPHT